MVRLGEWLIRKVGWGWSFVICALMATVMGIAILLVYEGVIAVVLFSFCFAFAAFFSLSSFIFHKAGIWHDNDISRKGRK
jgi:hypothetical protein